MNDNNTHKVTDLSYLVEISNGDTEFIKEMINVFLNENPIELTVLEKAIKEIDFEKIKSATHKMKSTIPFVGIDKIIENDILEIEKIASERSGIEPVIRLFLNIKKVCLTAAEELKNEFSENNMLSDGAQ